MVNVIFFNLLFIVSSFAIVNLNIFNNLVLEENYQSYEVQLK